MNKEELIKLGILIHNENWDSLEKFFVDEKVRIGLLGEKAEPDKLQSLQGQLQYLTVMQRFKEVIRRQAEELRKNG